MSQGASTGDSSSRYAAVSGRLHAPATQKPSFGGASLFDAAAHFRPDFAKPIQGPTDEARAAHSKQLEAEASAKREQEELASQITIESDDPVFEGRKPESESSSSSSSSRYSQTSSSFRSSTPGSEEKPAASDDHTRNNAIPIIQFPARPLWAHHHPMPAAKIHTNEFMSMLRKLKEARAYYKYPSLCAPQIGWNERVFVMGDGAVWVNPEVVETSEDSQGSDDDFIKTCWAWEPCASCPQFLHYVERPFSCTIRGLDQNGKPMQKEYTKFRARMALHEIDHLEGRLFTRKIKNGNYAVPMDSFASMTEWPDDFPSIEARSTHLHTLFVPPNKFIPDVMPDGDFFHRQMDSNIYPGCDIPDDAVKEFGTFKEFARARYRSMKQDEHEKRAAAAEPYVEEDDSASASAKFTPAAEEEDEDE